VIEAGYAGRALTPREFMEVFGVVEPSSVNGYHSEDTIEAAAELETAEATYARLNDEVGRLILGLRQRDDPDLEAALQVAAAERAEAADALTAARVHHQGLARRDHQRRLAEQYAADLAAQAQARQERQRERVERGRGVLARLRKGRS
jgi:hypothetical protein